MRIIFLWIVILITLLIPSKILSQQSTDGRVLAHYFLNPVVQPQGIDDVVKNCANSDKCMAVVDAAASAWFGTQPGTVKDTMAFARMAGLTVQSSPDGGHFRFTPPTGYQICHARLSTTSLVPFAEKHSPQFATTLYLDRVDVTLTTPQRGWLKGRTFYEGVLSVLYIPASDSNKTGCLINLQHPQQLYICKGGQKISDHDPCYGSYWLPYRP